MEALPSHPPTTTTSTALSGYPDSNDSSPHSRQVDTNYDESLPQVLGSKLRIMCSYGGHIIPRPHDKFLCYVGGETRMVVIDRHSSLSSLCARLSQSLLGGRYFTLKYQLPNEELDSLISVTTDEDLENMVEEYDRILSSSPSKPSRLRLFLFLVKPETAASMGSLFNDAKSETWFVDALNGTGLLPRGLSDSAVNGCLLQLDEGADSRSLLSTDLEAQTDSQNNNNNKHVKNLQELQATMPDSPLMETGSSFGSSSSSPSMSNLPPIRVRVDDSAVKFQNQMAGLDEQFSQIGISTSSAQKQPSAQPPIMPIVTGNRTPVSVVYNDTQGNRIVSDDENSDQAVPAGFRKPPLPLQLMQRKLVDGYNLPSPDSKNVAGFNFPSPDSATSDSSIGHAISHSKNAGNHEPTQMSTSEYTATHVTAPMANTQEQNSQVNIQQVHEHTYLTPPQQIQQQQQYIHPGIQYIHHHPATGQPPLSSYYPMYDQRHYPMYVLPPAQNQVHQPYNYPIQANTTDSNMMASNRPPPGPPQSNSIANQPIYTTNRPEMGGNIYTTATQFQQQYAPIQNNTPPPGVNYGYEYALPTNEQVYYSQHPVAQLPPQHQTLTAATAVMFAQTSAQLPAENNGQ